jgi:hypothetical protein
LRLVDLGKRGVDLALAGEGVGEPAEVVGGSVVVVAMRSLSRTMSRRKAATWTMRA